MNRLMSSYPEGTLLSKVDAVRLFLVNAPHMLRQARNARGTF